MLYFTHFDLIGVWVYKYIIIVKNSMNKEQNIHRLLEICVCTTGALPDR